jgi:hypothetical protein
MKTTKSTTKTTATAVNPKAKKAAAPAKPATPVTNHRFAVAVKDGAFQISESGTLVASVAKGEEGWKVTPSPTKLTMSAWRPSRKAWSTAPEAVDSYFRSSVGGKELIAAVATLSK